MTEHAQTEYRAISFAELCDRLCEKKKTLIIFHSHPDGDALGSAFALRQLLLAAGSQTRCVCADEPHRRYRFAVEGLQDAGLLPEAVPADFEDCRVITVDTPSRAQMGRVYELYGRRADIMIDHHGRGEVYADNYIDTTAAATGEIIFDISRELMSRGIIKEIPERLDLLTYIAIATDTGCFKYSNTTPGTHMRVAELMESFDYADVNFRLFDSKTPEELKVTRTALENTVYFDDGAISVCTLTLEQKKVLNVPDEYLDLLIEVARATEGTRIAASIKQASTDDNGSGDGVNTYKISLRSSSQTDVSAICSKFGGGGHRKASGCTLRAANMDGAVGMIVEEIRRAMADDILNQLENDTKKPSKNRIN